MTVVVPEPVPLEMPDEHPDALTDLLLSVAGAAESLALVGDCLAPTEGAVPHWTGADAGAAASQLRVLRGLSGQCSAAVLSVAGRLSVHSDRLSATRTAVAGLRAEQDDDFAVTWRRLSQLPEWVTAVRTDAPAAQALVEELRAAEEGRRRRHAAVLEELAADAAATARVLADAAGVVGGRGAPGDGDRVTGRLAPALPGWGNPEVAARGRALAQALLDAAPGDLPSLVRGAAPYATQVPFADGLLLGLGVDGLRELLGRLGDTELSLGRPVAELLGRALGSARPTGAADDPIGELLTATCLDPAAFGLDADRVVLGMGVVLAATRPTDGPPMATVVAWGRQMLAREGLQARGASGTRAVDRELPGDASLPHDDPVALVADRLAGAADHEFAAQLLGDRSSWDVLLSRPWNDGGTVLAGLVAAAGAQPGPVGDVAVRAGLEALGVGLGADGNPAHWAVDRATAAVVAPALGSAVAAHADVVAATLWSGVTGAAGASWTDALRGLGYLTLAEGAAVAIHRALIDWCRVLPVPVGAAGPMPLLPAAVLPASYAAVEEYGQRLTYALHGFRMERDAESRARKWDLTVGLLVNFLPGRAGVAGGLIADYAAQALGSDGTWDNGPDRGRHFTRVDAVGETIQALPAEAVDGIPVVAAQAGTGYDRTAAVLGLPKPPASPVSHWWRPLVDAVEPGFTDFHGMGEKTDHELRRLMLQMGFADAVDGTPVGLP